MEITKSYAQLATILKAKYVLSVQFSLVWLGVSYDISTYLRYDKNKLSTVPYTKTQLSSCTDIDNILQGDSINFWVSHEILRRADQLLFHV